MRFGLFNFNKMKVFLKNIFYFSISFLLLFAFLEFKLSHLNNSYKYKRECLESKLDSIEILVLGASGMTQGVDPSNFKLYGYNLSNVSQTLFYDCRLTLKYLDRMPNLKFVVIGLSYTSFGEQLFDGIEFWRDFFYFQFWDINYPETKKYDLRKYSKYFLYGPENTFTFLKQNFKANQISGFKENGFLWTDSLQNNPGISFEKGFQNVRHHNTEFKLNRINENKKDLMELISKLKEKNITPILITPPLYKTYSIYMSDQIQKINSELIRSITDSFHCAYYDYSHSSIFNKKDFFDNNHLNFIGARKLSVLINKEVSNSTKPSH